MPKVKVNNMEKLVPSVDKEGFQRVEKGKRVEKEVVPVKTKVANRFDILNSQEQETLICLREEGGDPSTSNG